MRPSAKALSTLLSTASLDKLPQSQERGITLDLGFSAFFIPVPEHLKGRAQDGQREMQARRCEREHARSDSFSFSAAACSLSLFCPDRYDTVQVTLVDCPGHASLIRTIIGGAGIIDLMLLVLDATKGIQTQTAECLVIGEILTDRLVVVLNKTDLLPEPDKQLPKIEKNLRAVFANTKFGKDVKIVPVSANPGSVDDLKIKEGGAAAGATKGAAAAAAASAAASSSAAAAVSTPAVAASAPRVSALVEALAASLKDAPFRVSSDAHAPFLFAVDHCFQIRGQGTVLTGTVLSGHIAVGQMVEIPNLKLERKIKSMQRFRQPVESAAQGDRSDRHSPFGRIASMANEPQSVVARRLLTLLIDRLFRVAAQCWDLRDTIGLQAGGARVGVQSRFCAHIRRRDRGGGQGALLQGALRQQGQVPRVHRPCDRHGHCTLLWRTHASRRRPNWQTTAQRRICRCCRRVLLHFFLFSCFFFLLWLRPSPYSCRARDVL